MISKSLILREVRSITKGGTLWRLRIVVGAGAFFCFLSVWLKARNGGNDGSALFQAIHSGVLLMILLAAPLMTAETVSRERREGTLDLLFLTPLTAQSIVRSKFAVQMLRMGMVWVVSIPFVVIPVLLGGVTVNDLAMNLLLEMSLVMIALVSGLVVSVHASGKMAAIFGSILLTLAVVAVNCGIQGVLLANAMPRPPAEGWSRVIVYAEMGLSIFLQGARLARFFPGSAGSLWTAVLQDSMIVMAGALWAVVFLGRSMEAGKQGETAVRRWARKTFFEPLFWKEAFKRAMRRRLERNPLIWLEYRTAWKRSGRWSLVGLLMVIESFLVATGIGGDFFDAQLWVGFVLLVLLGISSAGSFNKEMESGAFELLLVAPMTENELVRRRLRAVASYYLPVGVLLLLFVNGPQMIGLRASDLRQSQITYAVSMILSTVTIPVVGLYWALTRRNFLTILAGTIAIGLVGPLLIWNVAAGLLSSWGYLWEFAPRGSRFVGTFYLQRIPSAQLAILLHLGLIGWFYRSAVNTLKERRFSF